MGERPIGSATAQADAVSMDGFSLGEPALVCRWRLAGGRLPMANRHLRALGARRIDGTTIPLNLVSWAKQHIEWTLAPGAFSDPDGVLMLLIDHDLHAAMTVGPYEGLASPDAACLLDRALASAHEADEQGVAPETMWAVADGAVMGGIEHGQTASGAATLVGDLLATLDVTVSHEPLLAARLSAGEVRTDATFLVSDEHGVVVPSDAPVADEETSLLVRRLVDGYQRLLDVTADSRR
jgi:hypothetical protein